MIELWPHQKRTVAFASKTPIVFDTSSAGTGKTLAHLSVAKNRFDDDMSRLLVVCPKSLMLSAWATEMDELFPDFKYTLAIAPEKVREAAFDGDSDIVIMNTDALAWLDSKGKRWLKKRMGKTAGILIDESSWLKNPSASRTQGGMSVAKAFKYRTCMSGTPAPTTVVELWPQVKILDDGARLGTRVHAFEHEVRYKTIDENGWPVKLDKRDAPAIAYGLIADITVGHKFDDVMKHVPPMEDRIIWYSLDDKHRDVYETLKEKAYLELESKETVTAVNAGVLANKLLQCASGAVYTDPTDEDRGWHVVSPGRYELIADLAEARDQTVVFFTWKHQRDELIKQLKKRKMSFGLLDSSVPNVNTRNGYVKAFQNGDLRVMLMHYETGAFGLTLTRARTIIWASPIYLADKKEQGDARIRRGRQDQPTESIVILARDTRDAHAYGVFSGKKTRMDALAELLQRS